MGSTKTYLEEARELICAHQTWSIESLTNKFCKDMNCDRGTAVYFLEKAIENDIACGWSYNYDSENDYDRT